MKREGFATLVKEAKVDSEVMLRLLVILDPLIKSYIKKLFFMEVDDAKQEIVLAIIEAVNSITKCLSDGECFTYISNAVKFKHAYLCKKNIRKEQNEDLYEKDLETAYLEKYENVNMMVDLQKKISLLSKNQKEIFEYLILGYSDREIAEKLNMSRQYINRIKKKLTT